MTTLWSDFHESMQQKHHSVLMLEDLEMVEEYDFEAIAGVVGIDDRKIRTLMNRMKR